MKVFASCRLCAGEVRGERYYHTPTESWRVGCPACGSFVSAKVHEGLERKWVDRQEELLDKA